MCAESAFALPFATMPCQTPSASSLTHACTVPLDPMSSGPASGTDTNDVEPLNFNAWPYLPAAHVAAVIEPLLPFPDRSAVPAPVPSLNG